MANYANESWGLRAGGLSAFWDSQGRLIGNINEYDEGLLIVDNSRGNWEATVHNIAQTTGSYI